MTSCCHTFIPKPFLYILWAAVNLFLIVIFITLTLCNKSCCIVSGVASPSTSMDGPVSLLKFVANGDSCGLMSLVEGYMFICSFLYY